MIQAIYLNIHCQDDDIASDISRCCCHFPIGILGQVWCSIVSIPDLCPLNYFTLKKVLDW